MGSIAVTLADYLDNDSSSSNDLFSALTSKQEDEDVNVTSKAISLADYLGK
jgi:hypothetical protein